MGADFIFQSVIMKNSEEETKQKIIKAINNFSIIELKRGIKNKIVCSLEENKSEEFSQFCEFWENGIFKDFDNFMPIGENENILTEYEAKKYMINAVEDFFYCLNCREIGTLSFKGYTIYLTGGMSWGDNPTESFNTFCAFNNLPVNILKGKVE